MNLMMDASLGLQYKSQSQVARRVTEDWAAGNLYCVACPSNRLVSEPANRPVHDYSCPECSATYQLKSKNGRFGRSVHNSAYGPKIQAITQGRVPHYTFLQYSRLDWTVTDLFVVPGHFVSPAVIQRRTPLKPTAKRAGWVGSNILLGQLSAECRITVVSGGAIRESGLVRRDWRRFEFLPNDERARGGWGAEVLSCVRALDREKEDQKFTLQEFYARFEDQLTNWHPDNHHVQDKIRQQLQVLRDGGVLTFLGHGRYSLVR